MHPRIFLNAKVYPQVTGEGVMALAEACDQAGEDAGVEIALAPPMVELASVANLELDHVAIYAQHCDALEPGSGTGWTTAEAIDGAGAVGSILNHAEHKIPHSQVQATLERLHALGLESLVCADSVEETQALAPMAPSFIAVEPPELIGGDTSVTTADPSIVRNAADAVHALSPETFTLCGAGVKNGRDVKAALELGAYGVLLASGVVKADDPLAALRDLCSGL